MNWNLAGLKNAITNTHINPDGTFTKNLIACGKKGWGFLKDTDGIKFSSTDFYNDDRFFLHKAPLGCRYAIEFVVLNAGDMLYVLLPCFQICIS